MTSLNERAWLCLERAMEDQHRLNISVQVLECGIWLLDAGVNVPGSLDAGLVMADVCMATMGAARLELAPLTAIPWPWVEVRSDHPLEACFLSQAAHWPVQTDGFRAMGSGPACLLNQALDIGKQFGFSEQSDCAVLVLETRQIPDESVCLYLADACGVTPEKLALLVAPTSSLAGSTQIAARSIETGLHRLQALGFDLRMVSAGMGRCPIAGPTGDDLTSLGRTNDMVMFASQVWLSIRGVSDAILTDVLAKLPASTSPGYGPPFIEALKKAGGFYELDPGLFAPAEITLANLDSGRTFHAGAVDTDRLARLLKG
jgi:methenyltetrahydromethanopterin cyclohydrolase